LLIVAIGVRTDRPSGISRGTGAMLRTRTGVARELGRSIFGPGDGRHARNGRAVPFPACGAIAFILVESALCFNDDVVIV
jgi:hypothetical protein